MRIVLSVALFLGIVLSVPTMRGGDWERIQLIEVNVKANECETIALPEGCHEFVFEGEIGLKGVMSGHALHGKGWRLEMLDGDGNVLKMLELEYRTRDAGGVFEDRRVAVCRVWDEGVWDNGVKKTLENEVVFENENDIYGRINVVAVENKGERARFWAGAKGGVYAGEGAFRGGVRALRIGGERGMTLRSAALKWRGDRGVELMSGWNIEELTEAASGGQGGVEGVWRFLDRDTESELAEPGGRYVLGVVAHRGGMVVPTADATDGGRVPDFDIVYLSGAVANGRVWRPGMVKGHLYSTGFGGHYDVVWYDADLESMGEETFADVESGGMILTVNFPLYRGLMRFERVATR